MERENINRIFKAKVHHSQVELEREIVIGSFGDYIKTQCGVLSYTPVLTEHISLVTCDKCLKYLNK